MRSASLALPLTAGRCGAPLAAGFLLLLAAGCSPPPPRTPTAVNGEPEVEPSLACAGTVTLDPLVTEWPASEKAHLQSLLSQQPVAVKYTGCELQILDECKLSGHYLWKPSPISSAALTIDSKEDLAAKLPIGGFRLEEELARSGSLLVRTTVSGSFELAEADRETADIGPCAPATHVIGSMSVGSFSLVSRARSDTETVATTPILDAQVRTSDDERLLREAGVPEACETPMETAPAKQCASPIRVVLLPLEQHQPTTRLEQAQKTGEVFVHIPQAEGDASRWTLHDSRGAAVCEIPCSRWLRPGAGYSLRRAGSDAEVIPIAGGFPVAPGRSAQGLYQAERGAPGLSSTTFWVVGAPSLVFGGLLTLSGAIVMLNSDDDETEFGLLVTGLGLSAVGGGLWWWYEWSEEASFQVKEMPSRKQSPPSARIGVGLGTLGGQF